MTRQQALEVAKINHAAHRAADLAHMFGRGPAFDAEADYGFRHGWYAVGQFCFCTDEITGIPYDATQGGWAHL